MEIGKVDPFEGLDKTQLSFECLFCGDYQNLAEAKLPPINRMCNDCVKVLKFTIRYNKLIQNK